MSVKQDKILAANIIGIKNKELEVLKDRCIQLEADLLRLQSEVLKIASFAAKGKSDVALICIIDLAKKIAYSIAESAEYAKAEGATQPQVHTFQKPQTPDRYGVSPGDVLTHKEGVKCMVVEVVQDGLYRVHSDGNASRTSDEPGAYPLEFNDHAYNFEGLLDRSQPQSNN